jgi:uncharacterized membrane protein YhaH (DUF805 family)
MNIRHLFRLAFGFSEPVSRRTYLTAGLTLAGFKYLVEGVVLHLAIGRVWTPFDYLVPSIQRHADLQPESLRIALAIWTLPFIWIGVSMTVRRALDAGLPALMGLLFFVPLVNYLVLLAVAAQPTRPPYSTESADRIARGRSALRSAFLAVVAAVVIMAAATAFSTWVLRSYATILFVGTPFVMGFVSAWVFNGDAPRSNRATLGLACISVLASGGVLLTLAMEGAFCIAMAMPIAIVLAMLGAAMAKGMCPRRAPWAAPPIVVLLGLPLLMGAIPNEVSPLREQASSIEVDAPPEVVWRNVVGFDEIPPPTEWAFRHGIAYPIRATIAGHGPGAIRRCEFSTGAFVEPITVWDEPRRLAFDVADEPPGMRELSPYETVHAPHVSGYLKSRRGEFRLMALPGGRTRLAGSTYYTLDVFPSWYWSRYADAIIERIHMRVLRHVKRLSETTR